MHLSLIHIYAIPAEFLRIGGKQLGVCAGKRHSDTIVFTLYRHKITHGDQLVTLGINPAKRNYALCIIIIGNPGKSFPRKVNFPEL